MAVHDDTEQEDVTHDDGTEDVMQVLAAAIHFFHFQGE